MSAFPQITREFTPDREHVIINTGTRSGLTNGDEVSFGNLANRDTYGYLRLFNMQGENISLKKPGDTQYTTFVVPHDLVDLPGPIYDAVQYDSSWGSDVVISLIYHSS